MAETAIHSESVERADMAVGEVLSRTREHYGQSIEDVEQVLRIRACQIKAIETGDLAALPGRVYAIGFVRSYAEHLGLDGDKMVAMFKQQTADAAPEPELYFPVAASDSRLPAWWVVLLCVLGVIVILSFWLGSNHTQRESVEYVPTVSERLGNGSQIAAPSIVIGEDGAASAEAPPVEDVIEAKPIQGIILNIRQNSWVEIRDRNGKAMISRVLNAGDQYYVPDRPDLTISIGNAGGVEIEVDGQPLRKLGEQGRVLRRLSLDAEYLKENFALEQAQ